MSFTVGREGLDGFVDPVGDLRCAVDGLFDELEEAHGPVMVLVNNAGTRADALSPMIDDEAWDRVIETNLSAAFRTTRRALRPMIRARFGRVINGRIPARPTTLPRRLA